MQEAFDKFKKKFSETPLLLRADYEKPFYLDTDASDHAAGGIL